jgi:hypothetical protein
VEQLVADRTFELDYVIPEHCNTASAEVVSTWCENWAVEHIQTDGT